MGSFPSGRHQPHDSWYEIGKDVARLLDRTEALLHNQGVIMGKIDELHAQVEALQAAVDSDQAADAQVVRDMQAEIDRLNQLIADGATGDQLQAVVDRLEEIKADISGPNETPTEPNS